MANRKILLTGGIKSGKSRHALEIGGNLAGDKIFVATAQAWDAEMKTRIEKHKAERSADWRTIEEPLEIAHVLNSHKNGVFIIDCLTIWTSNLLEKADEAEFQKEADRLASAVAEFKGTVILVTNEVGLGIIPANAASRKYGDRLGLLNQKIAAVCDTVAMLVAGLPVQIKGKI
jgi:adenosylcobinamide kinase/adenosylcobinamide-phosphate guanylyltransferase